MCGFTLILTFPQGRGVAEARVRAPDTALAQRYARLSRQLLDVTRAL